MNWKPLLEGALAGEAARSALVVCEELGGKASKRTPRSPWNKGAAARREPGSLAGAMAGSAILLSYVDASGLRRGTAPMAWRFQRDALEQATSSESGSGLYSGFPGVAWTLAHLDRTGAHEESDRLAVFDGRVESLLRRRTWTGDFDLVNGLVGLGVYALERSPRPVALRSLELVLGHLASIREEDGAAVTWRTAKRLIPQEDQGDFPHGRVDAGVAHGVPGVIAFLGLVTSIYPGNSEASRLLRGAVTWLLRVKRRGPGPAYPFWFVPGVEPGNCRTAWCYGDAGVAAALLLAARSASEREWERAAVEVALRAARRSPDETGVLDAGLCHGAAGLGHVFNRLWQATGHEELKAAALRWFRRTLEMRRPGTGFGGFVAASPGPHGGVDYMPDPTFLTGSAGVALALLAAARPVEPGWDRLLLLSGRGPDSARE